MQSEQELAEAEAAAQADFEEALAALGLAPDELANVSTAAAGGGAPRAAGGGKDEGAFDFENHKGRYYFEKLGILPGPQHGEAGGRTGIIKYHKI